MPGNGYPMRLLVPGYQGNMNVKFLRRIKVDQSAGLTVFFETQELLPDSAGRQDVALPLPGWRSRGLHDPPFVRPPTSRSRASTPFRASPIGCRAHRQGAGVGGRRQELGRSRLCRGRSTTRPSPASRMPWRWDGQPDSLAICAWDEAGNVQPLRAEFVAASRPDAAEPLTTPLAFPNQHYNSLHQWASR